jgi:hypothetical protein
LNLEKTRFNSSIVGSINDKDSSKGKRCKFKSIRKTCLIACCLKKTDKTVIEEEYLLDY